MAYSGGEFPKSRRSRRGSGASHPTSTDAVEIAMTAERDGTEPAGLAATLLEKQSRLIDIQAAREREELRVLRLQGLGRTILLTLVLLLLAGIGSALWSASRSNVLVVEPFRVPADLAANGLSGEAIAARLLDEVAALQAQTDSVRPADSFANNWDDRIDIVIPQTGVSIGEFWRLMRRWLGSETRISGEVVRGADGISVTARVSGGSPAARKIGPEAEIGRLIREAALAVYADTQPYRYSVYLVQINRLDEAQAVARRLAVSGPPAERPWGRVALANILYYSLGDVAGGIREMEAATHALPDLAMPRSNLSDMYLAAGREETAYHHLREAVRLGRGGRNMSANFRDLSPHRDAGRLASMTGDYVAAARLHRRASEGAHSEFRRLEETYNAAFALSFVDPVAARTLFATVPAGFPDHRWRDLYVQWTAHNGAILAGDWPAAVAAGERTRARLADIAANSGLWGRLPLLWIRTMVAPTLAPALAQTGAMEEARALVAAMPAGCHRCVIARGQVAALAGDHQEAERAFAEAALLGPSLPHAPAARGRYLLKRGDKAGAIQALKAANRLGPGWAEPLRYWGDALAGEGDWRGAERLYAQAAARAPGWGALHMEWANSLWMLRRHDEARAKLAAAEAMLLSPGDRARLARMREAAR